MREKSAPSGSRRPAAGYQPKGLTIIYEDRDLIVIEKPCGLLSIGTGRDRARTVHTILNDYVRKGDPRSRNRVYIVHRLDRETSGLLILARSEAAKLFLQEHWQETEKHYLTVVHGTFVPAEGTISSNLAENSAHRVYSTSDAASGKLSLTGYRVLKEAKGFSLLDIHLLTGRKHQIRVHMSENGHPVVGDRIYGRKNDACGTLALHARSISFTHPVNGKRLAFETGIPDIFTRLVGRIGEPVVM
ncbi:MAG: RluA family pseudouridine synthase [Deltaproteobacteria bacterium]|nr:RluA family pseudouridine synthase [Deltaproteobacteria bacterium]